MSRAPENLVGRSFRADAPDELWLTDITKFRLPSECKVYLRRYCEGRIKHSLGWMSPNEYRRSLGYAA